MPLEYAPAYVRFSDAKVARTIPIDTDGVFVGMDLDEKGSVIGIEVLAKGYLAGGPISFPGRQLVRPMPPLCRLLSM